MMVAVRRSGSAGNLDRLDDDQQDLVKLIQEQGLIEEDGEG